MSDDSNSDSRNVNRRALLKLVSAGAATTVLPIAGAAAADSMQGMHHAMPTPPAPGEEPAPVYEFFNGDEAAFIEAAVDTLIPSDEVGPGALELGVATFIDRQLNSGYGRGDRMYLQGPFIEGTPQQGYQLRMTPSELIRNGILDVNAKVREKYKVPFDALSNEDRVAVLTQLERRELELPTVPVAIFFQPAVRPHDAGLLLRSAVRRQQGQGVMEDDRLSGDRRHVCRQDRSVPQQAVHDRADEHSGSALSIFCFFRVPKSS